jgi:hypothetical protein
MKQKEKSKNKLLKVKRGTDGSIQVDPSSLYKSEGVLKQLQACQRFAKILNLKRGID